MSPEQIFIGGATALLCLAGLRHNAWLLEHTRKGRRLVDCFGAVRAVWILRSLFIAGALFGALLAIGAINPVRW